MTQIALLPIAGWCEKQTRVGENPPCSVCGRTGTFGTTIHSSQGQRPDVNRGWEKIMYCINKVVGASRLLTTTLNLRGLRRSG